MAVHRISFFLAFIFLGSIHFTSAKTVKLSPDNLQPVIGIIGDEDLFEFRLSSSDVMLFEIRQINADLKLTLLDSQDNLIFLTSVPARDWLPEEVMVTSKDCTDCRLRVEPVEQVDKSGSYELRSVLLSNQKNQDDILFQTTMMQASIKWFQSSDDTELLKDVLSLYRKAYDNAEKLSPVAKQRSLYLASQVASLLGDFNTEKTLLEKVIAVSDSPDNLYHLKAVFALGVLAFVERNFDAARDSFMTAKKLAMTQKDDLMFSKIESRLGLIEGEEGQQAQASLLFDTAYQAFIKSGDWRSALEGLINLGWSNLRKGELEVSLNYYHQAQSFARKTGLLRLEVEANTGIGAVYGRLGDVDQAIKYTDLALVHSEKFANSVVHGRALQAKAQVLMNAGMFARALDVFDEALEAYSKANSKSDEMNIRFYLGRVHTSLENYAEAEVNFEQVLNFDKKTGNKYYIGTGYNQLAELAFKQKKYAKALAYQEEAIINIQTIDDDHSKGRLYSQSGIVYFYGGDREKSRHYFELSKQFQSKIQDKLGQIRTGYRMATTYNAMGDKASAIKVLTEAIEKIQFQGEKISRVDLKQNYLALQQKISALQVKLMHETNVRPEDLLQLVESFRSRTLLEKISSLGRKKVIAPELALKRSQLQNEIQSQVVDYHQLSNPEIRESVLKKTRELSSQLQQLEVSIKNTQPKMRAVKEIPALDLRRLQRLMSESTLILYFDTNPDESYLWTVSNDEVEFYKLASADLLTQKTLNVLNLIRNSPISLQESRKRAQAEAFDELSKALFADVKIDWSKYHKLVVVPDGPINYLPLSILTPPGNEKQLLQDKQISYVSSLNVLNQLDSRTSGKNNQQKVLLVANPVFKNNPQLVSVLPRLRSGFDMLELPYTQKEADSILKVAGGSASLLSRENANKANLLAKTLTDYQIIHFATHGLASSELSSLGGLVLSNAYSDNNLLLAPEIVGLDIDAELVVLSGCETAIGRLVDGEGLQGLSRAFFEAGAKRVIASLWPVQDDATAQLMQHFYQSLLVDKRQPAEALRLAKLHIKNYRRKNNYKPWQDPFYWAGFILQGNGESWVDESI